MPRTLEQWKSETATLSPEDRAALAEHLLESLNESDVNDAEWEAELDRRVEDLRSGKEVGIPVEKVLAELKDEFGECALLSESALADWSRPEEDAAWAHLQSAK